MNSNISQSELIGKGIKSIFPVILLFLFFNTSAQNTDKVMTYQDSINKIEDEIDELQKQIDEKQKDLTVLKQVLIGEQYKIGNNPTPAKVIKHSFMRSKPDKNSKILDIELNVNDIVMMYKYIASDQCWAIKHKGLIGFVPADAIMGISKSDVPDDSTDK